MLALAAFAGVAMVPFSLLQKYADKINAAGFAACALLVFFGNIVHVETIAQCSLGHVDGLVWGHLVVCNPQNF